MSSRRPTFSNIFDQAIKTSDSLESFGIIDKRKYSTRRHTKKRSKSTASTQNWLQNAPDPAENSQESPKFASFSYRAKRSMSVSGPDGLSWPQNRDDLDDLFDSDYEMDNSQVSTGTNHDDSSSIDDVCLPLDASDSDISAGGTKARSPGGSKPWIDLSVLEEHRKEELAEIHSIETNDSGTKFSPPSTADGVVGFSSPLVSKIDVTKAPPLLQHHINETEGLNGRLRPPKNHTSKSFSGWRPNSSSNFAEPFRFTYFREDLDTTIHASTISGLLRPEQNFADLFIQSKFARSKSVSRNVSSALLNAQSISRSLTPAPASVDQQSVFWLDVLNPSENEMKVISKAFGIHPLTTEDIILGETREKVELFNEYYFICFRSFDIVYEKFKTRVHNTLTNSEMFGSSKKSIFDKIRSFFTDESAESTSFGNLSPEAAAILKNTSKRIRSSKHNDLKPLNIYIVVFKQGVLTFHFAPTPHAVNVRRRCRLLKDYLSVSTDWIAYALIDDITDGFGPMIEQAEKEVADIEDSIIKLQSADSDDSDDSDNESIFDDKKSVNTNATESSISSGTSSPSSAGTSIIWQRKNDMLRRIGEARKRVMSLSRLLGSKADVIKGFSKKCNDTFAARSPSPSSEIGMYLGDIQDHIITMVQNLNHCEKLLARSHSNYLAQINIDMTKVNNDMNDVLGKLTMLGTIVLPLNVCTGLWGMNVLVPGQDAEGLKWFFSITSGMIIFALMMYIVARRIGVA